MAWKLYHLLVICTHFTFSTSILEIFFFQIWICSNKKSVSLTMQSVRTLVFTILSFPWSFEFSKLTLVLAPIFFWLWLLSFCAGTTATIGLISSSCNILESCTLNLLNFCHLSLYYSKYYVLLLSPANTNGPTFMETFPTFMMCRHDLLSWFLFKLCY